MLQYIKSYVHSYNLYKVLLVQGKTSRFRVLCSVVQTNFKWERSLSRFCLFTENFGKNYYDIHIFYCCPVFKFSRYGHSILVIIYSYEMYQLLIHL